MLPGIIDYFLIAFTSLFIIINPITTAFIFTALLPYSSNYEKKHIAYKSTIIAGIILFFFVITGQGLFKIFGITIGAFRIAGGLLLFGIAMGMVKSKGEHDEKFHTSSESDTEDIALIPLAIPFMSGPGSIATATLLATDSNNFFQILLILLAIVAVLTSCFYAMLYSQQIINLLGKTGKRIINKLFGLILIVIAIQFVINGVIDLLPSALEVINANM